MKKEINWISRFWEKYDSLDLKHKFLVVSEMTKRVRLLAGEKEVDLSEDLKCLSKFAQDVLVSMLGESLGKLKKLSEGNRKEAIEEIIAIVDRYVVKQAQEDLEEECHRDGHAYGDWRKSKDVKYSDAYIDHQIIPNYREEVTMWTRVCTRCGAKDISMDEPTEVTQVRMAKKKASEIKRLEKRLKSLKNSN